MNLVVFLLLLPACARSKSNRLFTTRRVATTTSLNGLPAWNKLLRPPFQPQQLLPFVRGGGGGGSPFPRSDRKDKASPLKAAAMAVPLPQLSLSQPPKISAATRAKVTVQQTQDVLASLVTRRNVSLALCALVLMSFCYNYRDVLLNKEKIQDETLRLLRQLAGNDSSKMKSLTLYACGMACWEALGLSTIPVETAAGMVFGWPAAAASLSGKLVGALASFTIGRLVLADKAQASLQKYKLFQQLLVQQQKQQQQKSITATTPVRWQSHPLTTAFLMKFSCFPELVKNVGSSVLPSMGVLSFVFATFIHGGMFTLLWSWWGVETAARIVADQGGIVHAVPVGLQVALMGAAVIGVVVSPLLMAWWIRDLQKQTTATGSDGVFT